MEKEYYIIAVVVILIMAGIVVGIVYSVNRQGNQEYTDSGAMPPEPLRITPYAYLDRSVPVSRRQHELATASETRKLADKILALAKTDRVVEPEAPGSELPPRAEISELKAEIAGMGYPVCEMLPVLAKSVYDDPSTNATDWATRDMPKRWPEWIAVAFGIAGDCCGDWFVSSLAAGPQMVEVDEWHIKKSALVRELAGLKDAPLPPDPLVISQDYRELVNRISDMHPEEVRVAFAVAYKTEPGCRKWLGILARWYAGAELLKTASAWLDGEGFHKPDVRVKKALMHAMGKIPGGGEKLLERYLNRSNRLEKNTILYTLARGKYMPALPMLKGLASRAEGSSGPGPDAGEQTTALRALTFYGSADVAGFCRSVFEKAEVPQSVRKWALEPYGAILKEKAFDDLAQIFHMGEADEKLAAITGLAQIRTEKVSRFLGEIALFDPTPRVRNSAQNSANQMQRYMVEKGKKK